MSDDKLLIWTLREKGRAVIMRADEGGHRFRSTLSLDLYQAVIMHGVYDRNMLSIIDILMDLI